MVSWKLQPRFNFSTPFELDQYQTIDKLTSFHFNEIEFEHERELDLPFCDSISNFESMLTSVSLLDLDPIPEPILILVPIDLEHKLPILDNHISLLGKECESQIFIWTQLLNRN